MIEREVMDIREAAEYLHIASDSLYAYLNSGKVPGFKMGNRWRIRKSALDNWMAEQENSRCGRAPVNSEVGK